ncbi:NACHT and WD40 repeat domain-containing protein [Nostoc sp. UHCC 0251]|uniref:NACHT and WD40 repeat domain-containing protein n=1 Tax=Nostoc sp. UHCC 0251 TaxID=3110240 RepID=UPI002B20E5FA|nr:NB-ARC domain-containing protein [Nostoc sp. UHCC 0251]MEA5625955.1 NB-ARC domain-containing protein [Nostoc sp. UHCC 0251]
MKPEKLKRNRGFILTREGWQKLQNAKLEWEFRENNGSKCTLEELSEQIGITSVTFRKVLTREAKVDKRTLVSLFMMFNLELDQNDYISPDSDLKGQEDLKNPKRVDWGEMVDVSVFYGRTAELALLEEWLIQERCRVMALLGMGGIGKTSLAAKLAQKVQGCFEYVIWRSLYNAPPLFDLLANLIQFLSNEEILETDLPKSVDGRISQLIKYLQQQRCLIILDNVETILQTGAYAGCYREGYEDYGLLIKRLGQVIHRSSLVLTSREKPKDVASLTGEALAVRSLQLSGLEVVAGQKIFEAKGFSGSESELPRVVERYAGNALALKIVATTIQDVFDGNVAQFLQHYTAVFGSIRDLLDQQFSRLANLEKDIMYWLAINREPVSLSEIRGDIVSPIPAEKLLEALESLVRRSLVEKSTALFTLQPVVMEYVTQQLIEQVCEEIVTQNINLFRCHTLMKATAKDYVRETQIRLIIEPVIDGLFAVLRSKKNLENQLIQILASLRETSPLEQSYTAGNILNLLCHLETDISGYDFSNLSIWQADLRSFKLHDVNFQNANFNKSIFAETFGGVLSVAFSPNGKLLAIGDTNGEIHLRQLADGIQVLICKGHSSWVISLAFSPDGKTLASSSGDYTLKLWDIDTGQCLQTLQGHEQEVWSVAFSPDGTTLASASDDQMVKLWNISTGKCLKTLQGHTSWVHSVAFSSDGQMLVSGSDDHTVKLWNINTGECLKTFQGHCDGIRSIAVSPDGQMLASSSEDHTVKLWNLSTGKCLKTLQGHSNEIYSVAFSPQSNLLASGSHDRTVKLWDISTGECLRTFQGHSSWVYSVAFSPQGELLASGSYDQTARLWSVHTGQCFKTFKGYTDQILSVAFSPDGQMLASGSHDSSVRLWNVSTGQVLRNFQGHGAAVWSVAFCPDGQTLASGSEDQTVRLWNASTGQALETFQGHRALVWSVAFSPDGQTLASGSEDQTVRLWDVNTGKILRILEGHHAAVWSVAFSLQGGLLASGSHDQTVKLWDVSSGNCKRILEGHKAWVWSVAFSPDGKLLASTSPDKTIRLWNVHTNECVKVLQVDTGWLQLAAFSPDSRILACCNQDFTVQLWDVSMGRCLRTLQGHTGRVWSIAFNPDNRTLASSGEDETIRLWDITTGNCSKTLKAEKPYEQMNIKKVTGLNTATIATLKLLGAVA